MISRLLLLGLLITSTLTGCLQSAPKKKVAPDPIPIVSPIVAPIPVQPPRGLVIPGSLDASIVAQIYMYLGPSNRLTLTKQLIANTPAAKITFPAGTTVKWDNLTPDGGTFDFLDPKPIVESSFLGFKVHPTLEQIIIAAPNKGVAVAKELGHSVTKQFVIWGIPKCIQKPGTSDSPARLEEPNEEVIPEEFQTPFTPEETTPLIGKPSKPKMYAKGSKGCLPCLKAKKAIKDYIDSGKELPFDVVWDPNDVPIIAHDSTPTFWWNPVKDEPTGDVEQDWRIEGWTSVQSLIDSFNAKKGKPKNAPKKSTRINNPNDVKQRPKVAQFGFSSPWVEAGTGRTSVQHLVRDHGLSYESLKPYIGNQAALDRIHGWCHTHRSGRNM